MHVYRSRRAWRWRGASADRAGPGGQEGRRHRRCPVERRGNGRRARGRQGSRHSRAYLGLGRTAGEQGPACRLCRHPQLRDRRQPRQDRADHQAERRHHLHPVGRSCGGQPQRAHEGHTRYAGRQGVGGLAGRCPDRPERLDGSTGLPALYQRRLPSVGSAVPGLHGEDAKPRRLCSDRRLSAIHTGCQSRCGRAVQGQDRLEGAGLGRRRHLAGADGPDEGRPVARPGRTAAVRDGLQDHAGAEGHEGRQAGSGRPDLHRPRRLYPRNRRHLHRKVGEARNSAAGEGRLSPAFSLRGDDNSVCDWLKIDRCRQGLKEDSAGSRRRS
ncbi:conserved hypothetical protein [Mesorhizobium ventifaucium]|uniref:Uncharacterized protein n=1 Tax=Mesorhizobium ventifaucium TaxID=666020 RepID=A0ABM9EG28_9HYPH|nr:conserved hypothetical protein [Mesorhizobium ventifaucium]